MRVRLPGSPIFSFPENREECRIIIDKINFHGYIIVTKGRRGYKWYKT